MLAAAHGSAGGVAPLPAVRLHPAAGRHGRRPRRHQGAARDRGVDPHRHAAPGQGGLGPRRRRVQPHEVRARRRQGCQGPQGAADILHGPEGVHGAELRHRGGAGRHGDDPQQVLLLPLPEVRSQAKISPVLDSQEGDASDREEFRWVTNVANLVVMCENKCTATGQCVINGDVLSRYNENF